MSHSDTSAPAGADPFERSAHPRRRVRWRGGLGPVVVAIAAGGVVGAVCRYAISTALPHAPGGLPIATLLTNVVGCALIGVMMELISTVADGQRLLRPFLGVGVLGAFTTFSTYAVEAIEAIEHGAYAVAFGSILGTVFAALLAVWMGTTLCRLALRLIDKES